MRLSGKRIVLGVTGSIAAYKSASLCRLLVGEGADVQVIMTESATGFITPLTPFRFIKKSRSAPHDFRGSNLE
jgi:phosphopantothenoylcysteine decarboxylase/phosphopantothenate--cysteine ligase